MKKAVRKKKVDRDNGLVGVLRVRMEERLELTNQINELKEHLKTVDDRVKEVMGKMDQTKVSFDDGFSIGVYEGKSTSMSRKTLAKVMAQNHIPADKIEKIITKSTTETTYTTVRVFEKKGGNK